MFLNDKHNAGTGTKARVHVSRGAKITIAYRPIEKLVNKPGFVNGVP
jgi:hypothetical protein